MMDRKDRTELENNLVDALIVCHMLLNTEWHNLGYAEARCRSDKKRSTIKASRDRVQIARKSASAALREAGAMR